MILGITLGDVTGIGPEVALRAVARLTAEDTDVHYVLIGDTGVVRRLCGLMGVEADLPLWRGADSEPSRVYVLPVSDGELPENLPPGDPRAALEAVAALREGARRCLNGEFAGLVTAPVNKASIVEAGVPFIGQTEFLADLAGVSYPTISRIENGHEAPRWSTMQRLTHALGLDPSFTATQVTATYTLATVAKDWMKSPSRTGEPDWTSLRSFTDQLSLHPELSNLAIRQRPPRTGSPLVDNLLAAIAEKIAHDCGFRRPAWTRNVEPLASPWESQGTPRKRSTARTRTPIEFSRRGLFLDPVAIWRKNALTRA